MKCRDIIGKISSKYLIIAGVVALLVAFLLMIAFRNHKYEIIQPTIGTAVQAVYSTGVVEPVNWSKISANITGKIASVNVREGDMVKKGEILAKMDDKVEQAQLNEIQARYDYLKGEKKRQIILSQKGYSSQSLYDKVISDYDTTVAQLEAQKELLKRMTILSPISGTVLKRDIEPGEVVGPTQVLFWVGVTSPLRIESDVDEEDIPLVKVGQTALIKSDAFPDDILEGTISEITPKGDPVNKTFRVYINLPEDTRLMIGMTAEINIVTEKVDDAVILPVSAILNDEYVLVKNKFGKIEKRDIKIGVKNRDKVQILEGLSEDENVIGNPSTYLKK